MLFLHLNKKIKKSALIALTEICILPPLITKNKVAMTHITKEQKYTIKMFSEK